VSDVLRPAPRREEEAKRLPKNVGDMLTLGRQFLEAKGVESARLEAELLVGHALDMDRLHLYLTLDGPVERPEVDRARELLVRRAAGVPTAYLTGQREFYGRPFAVGPGVLIPRPETELLVDLARERAEQLGTSELLVGELGTGSGCVAVTLALEIDGARVVASDASEAALAFARENAAALGARVELVHGDGTAALLSAMPGGFDLLVSNPPYVDPTEADSLAREVRDHEPPEALFAPPGDPDHWVRRLLDDIERALLPGGVLLVELSAGQGLRAAELARERGLAPELHRDFAGLERVLEVRRSAV
jgi:release factor glutamine methyltransferase